MAVPRFFDRIHAAVGRHVEVERESLASALEDTVVAVVCGPECAGSGNGQWTAEVLVNLLARLYPRLGIESESAEIRDVLVGVARSIHPAVEVVDGDGEGDVLAVAVGRSEWSPQGAIHVRADGWVALI